MCTELPWSSTRFAGKVTLEILKLDVQRARQAIIMIGVTRLCIIARGGEFRLARVEREVGGGFGLDNGRPSVYFSEM